MKIFIDIAEVTDWNNRLIGKGAGTQTSLKINWLSLIMYNKTFLEECPRKIERHYLDKELIHITEELILRVKTL
jgi:glutathione reductase (NADPH)